MASATRHPRVAPLIALALVVLAAGPACTRTAPSDRAQPNADPIAADHLYYGVEINGVLCGYAEFKVTHLKDGGQELTGIDETVFAMLSALGMGFDSRIQLAYKVDPATGQFVYHRSQVDQEQIHLISEVHVDGDTAHFTFGDGGDAKDVPLPPGTLLENTLYFPHLVADFADSTVAAKTYDILELRDAEVQKTTYTRVGTEDVELNGRTYTALVLDEVNLSTGLKVTWWLDPATGRALKTIPLGNRVIYLADASVANRIKSANLDEVILSKVDLALPDFTAITYMKVRAELEPAGLWITPEGLNVAGQTFAGTVDENHIDGVFEIQHSRYDGTGAPVFPPPAYEDPSLKEYLKPDAFIESTDPVLADKARGLTEGSQDAWDAATRITRWVAEEIAYAIPGGGTPRKTYDLRAGECGAHSLLVATFCRAVGIPARVVWGCMYSPSGGGSFGQHAWNEIYMGEAGWIPVDATAAEADFVDSGHIRLGEMQSLTVAFNPKSMEVLDHRLRGGRRPARLPALRRTLPGAGGAPGIQGARHRGPEQRPRPRHPRPGDPGPERSRPRGPLGVHRLPASPHRVQ